MIQLKLIDNKKEIGTPEFNTRDEAERFITNLQSRSNIEWTYDARNDKWTSGTSVIEIVQVTLTPQEIQDKKDAKANRLDELIANEEAALVQCQTKLASLNAQKDTLLGR